MTKRKRKTTSRRRAKVDIPSRFRQHRAFRPELFDGNPDFAGTPLALSSSYGDLVACVRQLQQDAQRVPTLLMDAYRSEMRVRTAEDALATLRRQLVALLTEDQVDAAQVCGVTPAEYALHCIELYKEKFFPQMPVTLRPLAALKQGQF